MPKALDSAPIDEPEGPPSDDKSGSGSPRGSSIGGRPSLTSICEYSPLADAAEGDKQRRVCVRSAACAGVSVAITMAGLVVQLTSWHATPFLEVRGTEVDPSVCNPLAAPLERTLWAKDSAAPSFAPPWYSPWSGKCQSMDPPSSLTATPRWPGQDACWGWVKKIGCYETNSANDWLEAQKLAAAQDRAPPPEEFLMEAVRSPDTCMHVHLGAELTDFNESERLAATEWLNEHVVVYVLNLATDGERLATMSARLGELGIRWARIPGVDLRGPGAFEAAQKAGFVPEGFDFELAQDNANTEYQGMGGILGTVGCATAHLNAMKVAAGNYALSPQLGLALILEDDVRLADDFAVKLQRLLTTEVPCDWAAISLRSRCPYGECVSEHLTRVMPDGNEPEDRCRHGVNYGFFAMLYRLSELSALRARLADRVWDASAPRCLDVDVALASLSDKVSYYAVPFMQEPGFLVEGGHGSARFETNINNPATTTTTTTRILHEVAM